MSRGASKKFYRSKAWQRARLTALIQAGFRSCIDGSDVSGKGQAHVDHIRELRVAPELALDQLNLRVMSGQQHSQRHGRGGDEARQGCDETGWPQGKAHPWNLMRKG